MKYTGIAGSMRPTAMAASTGSPIIGMNTRNIATNTITTGRGRNTCEYGGFTCVQLYTSYIAKYVTLPLKGKLQSRIKELYWKICDNQMASYKAT